MMIDCERGLGRAQRGLDLGRTVDKAALAPDIRVSLAIAMSGARLDLGQNDLALVELEIKELNPTSVFDYSPRLFWAYADTLEVLGRMPESKKWAELATRAAAAIAAKNKSDVEEFAVLEEIEIPQASDFVRRERSEDRSPRRDGDGARKSFGSDRPRRDGDGARKSFGSDRPRRDGDGARKTFGSDRPRRDGDRPTRNSAPRKIHPRPEPAAQPPVEPPTEAVKKPQLDFGDSPKDRKPRGEKGEGRRGR
jgi:hypothetical protein